MVVQLDHRADKSRCMICDGPLSKSAKYGFCSKNPLCRMSAKFTHRQFCRANISVKQAKRYQQNKSRIRAKYRQRWPKARQRVMAWLDSDQGSWKMLDQLLLHDKAFGYGRKQ